MASGALLSRSYHKSDQDDAITGSPLMIRFGVGFNTIMIGIIDEKSCYVKGHSLVKYGYIKILV